MTCSYHSGLWAQIESGALYTKGTSAETGSNRLTSYFILPSRQDRTPTSEGKSGSELRLTSKTPRGLGYRNLSFLSQCSAVLGTLFFFSLGNKFLLFLFFAQRHISSDVFSFYKKTALIFSVWWVSSPQEKNVSYQRTDVSP